MCAVTLAFFNILLDQTLICYRNGSAFIAYVQIKVRADQGYIVTDKIINRQKLLYSS